MVMKGFTCPERIVSIEHTELCCTLVYLRLPADATVQNLRNRSRTQILVDGTISATLAKTIGPSSTSWRCKCLYVRLYDVLIRHFVKWA